MIRFKFLVLGIPLVVLVACSGGAEVGEDDGEIRFGPYTGKSLQNRLAVDAGNEEDFQYLNDLIEGLHASSASGSTDWVGLMDESPIGFWGRNERIIGAFLRASAEEGNYHAFEEFAKLGVRFCSDDSVRRDREILLENSRAIFHELANDPELSQVH